MNGGRNRKDWPEAAALIILSRCASGMSDNIR